MSDEQSEKKGSPTGAVILGGGAGAATGYFSTRYAKGKAVTNAAEAVQKGIREARTSEGPAYEPKNIYEKRYMAADEATKQSASLSIKENGLESLEKIGDIANVHEVNFAVDPHNPGKHYMLMRSNEEWHAVPNVQIPEGFAVGEGITERARIDTLKPTFDTAKSELTEIIGTTKKAETEALAGIHDIGLKDAFMGLEKSTKGAILLGTVAATAGLGYAGYKVFGPNTKKVDASKQASAGLQVS